MEGDIEFYKEYLAGLTDGEVRRIFDGEERLARLAAESAQVLVPLMGGGGRMTIYTPPKPKTLAEAKQLAEKLLNGAE